MTSPHSQRAVGKEIVTSIRSVIPRDHDRRRTTAREVATSHPNFGEGACDRSKGALQCRAPQNIGKTYLTEYKVSMDISNLQIREAEENDYKTVNLLYHQTYDLFHRNLPQSYKKTQKTILPRGTFLNLIDDEDALFLVAQINSEVIGMIYAGIEKYESDDVVIGYHRVSIYELAVMDKFQSNGVGHQLVRGAENWAKKKKISDIIVLAHCFNKEAINFYKKNGFIPYSIQLDKKVN